MKKLVPLICLGWVASIFGTWQLARLRRGDQMNATSDSSNLSMRMTHDSSAEGRKTLGARGQSQTGGGEDLLTPEKASQRLSRIRTIVNVMDRATEARKVIRALCRAGYVEGAWSLIDQAPGEVRDSQLSSFFAFSEESLGQDVLLDRIQNLGSEGYSGDQLTALGGLIGGLDAKGLLDLFGDPAYQAIHDQLKIDRNGEIRNRSMISSLLRMRVKTGDDPEGSLEVARSALKLGLIGDSHLMSILHSSQSLDAFSKFDMVNELIPNPNIANDHEKWRSSLVQQLVVQDPDRAMNLLMTGKEGSSDYDFSEGLRYWSTLEPGAAATWFADQRGRLSAAKADAAANAFCESAIASGSREIAIQWASEMLDQSKKKELMERVDRAFDVAQKE